MNRTGRGPRFTCRVSAGVSESILMFLLGRCQGFFFGQSSGKNPPILNLTQHFWNLAQKKPTHFFFQFKTFYRQMCLKQSKNTIKRLFFSKISRSRAKYMVNLDSFHNFRGLLSIYKWWGPTRILAIQIRARALAKEIHKRLWGPPSKNKVAKTIENLFQKWLLLKKFRARGGINLFSVIMAHFWRDF